MRKIVEIQLKRLNSILKEQNITLVPSESALDLLTKLGYEPAFGARPLKRVIQKYVQNELANALIDGSIHQGERVLLDAEDEEFVMKPE